MPPKIEQQVREPDHSTLRQKIIARGWSTRSAPPDSFTPTNTANVYCCFDSRGSANVSLLEAPFWAIL
jgi:hypothetical protein